MRRRTVLGAGGAVVAVGALAAAGLGLGGTRARPPVFSGGRLATAPVTRATLTRIERVSGRLGYGRQATFRARGTGIVTWLPEPGAVILPGQPVYKVDGQPVVLIAGEMPLYRALAGGMTGPDVQMIDSNLKSFGYKGFSAAAIRRWQRDLGIARPTGTLDPGRVAVAPGPVRIAEHKTEVGAPANGPVLGYTGTNRVVTVPLEVTRQHLIRPGAQATVSLPDGTKVTGQVSTIGTVATTPAGGQRPTPVVDVLVSIAGNDRLGALDETPVDLLLVVDRRDNVLTVPVGALVALAEGGYAIEAVEGSTTRYVPVTTGMFADGRVEVAGDGVVEGMPVGVPS